MNCGHIEAVSDSAPIDPQRWLALIDSHPSLGHVPPVQRTNPFTRKPMLVHAPNSTAVLFDNGIRVGSIAWAIDESPTLFVDTDEAEFWATVVKIAEEIATILKARFVLDMNEE